MKNLCKQCEQRIDAGWQCGLSDRDCPVCDRRAREVKPVDSLLDWHGWLVPSLLLALLMVQTIIWKGCRG